ncbi:MAG: DUF2232 domain-containing protein, partial [Rhodobacterales bacterium]|nr:DUF2232 domain-containing protein [Rhodobacterales bacterium]
VVQAAAMLVLGFLATMGAEGGTEAWVSGFLDRSLAAVMPGLGAEARLRVTGAFAQVFPGAVAGSWTLMVVVNGAIAQAILVRAGRNRRPPTPFRALELPHGLTGLLVAAAVVALAGSLMAWPEMRYMGRNLVVVLAVPYVFLGLAVVHTLVPRAPYPGLVLAAFYMVVILAGWPIVVIAATGLVEQWSGIRRRFAPPDDPHGASG